MKFTRQNDTLIATFSGHLDSSNTGSVQSAVDRELAAGQPKGVVFDMSEVSYVSSAFLRVCLATLKRIQPARLTVRGLRPDVKKVFVLAGFQALIDLE